MIRTIRNDDLDSIMELISRCQPYVIPHHKYQYWMISKYHSKTSFVYLEDGKVLGFLGCIQSIEMNSVFIWQICVDKSCRGMGIAARLLKDLVEMMKENDINRIDLTISKENEVSKKLFESFADSISSRLILDETLEMFDKPENVYRMDI